MTTRICYDHTAFSGQTYGGISRYLFEIASRIGNAAGFSTRIIAPLHRNAYLRRARVSCRGVYFPELPKTERIRQSLNQCLSRIFIGLGRYDVFHETYYVRETLAPKGCPIVLTVHDMLHEKFRDMFAPDDPTREYKKIAVARADQIICVSENTRGDLISILGVRPEKTCVIHHGYTLVSSDGAGVDLKIDRPFLLHVGGRRGYKNFANLLRAFSGSRLLRDAFVLVAFGGGKLSSSEMALMHSLGLRHDHVQAMSGGDATLACLYRQSSAFVYPSLYEGFGIPPLEAMQFDCPVVCSNTSAIREVVGEAACFFDPGDVDSMRSAMEEAVSRAATRERLVSLGRERIKLFSWDRCAENTMRVYRNVAGA